MYDSLQRPGKGEWKVLRVDGGPVPRTLAQVCVLPGARLLLYGGEGSDGMLNDCWLLHTRQAGEQGVSDTDIGLTSAGGYREAVARHLQGAAVGSYAKMQHAALTPVHSGPFVLRAFCFFLLPLGPFETACHAGKKTRPDAVSKAAAPNPVRCVPLVAVVVVFVAVRHSISGLCRWW